MAAIFATPMPLAGLTGTAIDTAPLANLLIDHMGMVWRSGSSTSNLVVPTGGVAFDTIALLRTNLIAGNSVRIRIGPNASGASPVVDVTLNGATNIFHTLASPSSAAFIRFDFTRPTFVEASRLIVSKRLECEGVSIGAEQIYDDASRTKSEGNATITENFDVFPNWKVSVEGILEDDFFLNWDVFLASVGTKLPFLFIPYTETNYISKILTYGKMTNGAKVTWITGVDRRVEMAIRGV